MTTYYRCFGADVGRHEHSVVEVARDIVMLCRGSYDMITPKYEERAQWLVERMRDWHPSVREEDVGFDQAVRRLVREAVIMHADWLAKGRAP
jgi:hypothetical protein